MKYTTTIRIDGDLWNLAKVNGINLSEAVDDLLKGYVLQFQTEEMKALREELDNTRVKLNNLECKYSTLNNERIKEFTYAKQLKSNPNFDRWIQNYRVTTEKNEVVREASIKTKIPPAIVLKILDDVK